MVITFDRHPKQVVQKEGMPRLLSLETEKQDLLHASKADHIEVLPFTEQLAAMTAQTFMTDILCKLEVKILVIGYDHSFGHGGGTFPEYTEWGKACGIEVVLAEAMPGGKVSSSRIRKLLTEGKLKEASKMLGHAYTLEGTVTEGHQIGRAMGFPTANLTPDAEKLIPANGVYAVWTTTEHDEKIPSVLNIGTRPTLHNGDNISIEVHLLHHEENLYHERLHLEFVERLREERQFQNMEELKSQIQKDVALAEDILNRKTGL